MENVINYIIDYKGYGNIYQLTNVRTGECNDLVRYQALDYYVNLQHKTFFSVRADVSLRAVDQVEVV
jgi:hypothetical protein